MINSFGFPWLFSKRVIKDEVSQIRTNTNVPHPGGCLVLALNERCLCGWAKSGKDCRAIVLHFISHSLKPSLSLNILSPNYTREWSMMMFPVDTNPPPNGTAFLRQPEANKLSTICSKFAWYSCNVRNSFRRNTDSFNNTHLGLIVNAN